VKICALLLALLLAGCNRAAPQTQDAVRQGVIEHLTAKSGLDLSSMDIEIASVSFRGNDADALVSFRPKGSSDPASGMQMKYTLQAKGGKWIVTGRPEGGGSPHGGAAPQDGTSGLPAGHPPIDAPPQGRNK
jgi:hypothetical protein